MLLMVLIYGALAVFIIANLVRFIRISTMPVHLRWELYPVPHEIPKRVSYGGSYLEETDWWTKALHSSKIGELKIMLPEIFLLKGVWEHNRSLWLWSWLFHYGLYFLIGAILLAIAGSILQLAGVTVTAADAAGLGSIIVTIMKFASWIAVTFGVVGTLGMLVKRTTDRKLSSFTSFGTIFNLLLIFALFATGLVSLIINKSMVGDMLSLVQGLLVFNVADAPNGVVLAHVIILVFFLFYFPFTHMTHMYTKYFTYHSVRWDDRPNRPGSQMEERIGRYLKYPVSWSAPHIQGKGEKNWADVVTEENDKDE